MHGFQKKTHSVLSQSLDLDPCSVRCHLTLFPLPYEPVLLYISARSSSRPPRTSDSQCRPDVPAANTPSAYRLGEFKCHRTACTWRGAIFPL